LAVVNGLQNVAMPFSQRVSPDDRQPLDVAKVLEIELHVFPHRAGVPAVKIVHLEEDPYLAVLFDQLFRVRHEFFVVLLRQLAGHAHFQNVAALRFLEFKRHDEISCCWRRQ
jgi:hypothetical protein